MLQAKTTGVSPLSIGEPGRAATELPAGKPPALLTSADHEISECSFEGVDVRAASIRGLMHRYREEPRQDRFALAYDEASKTLLIAVCDGVGSLALSHEAAEFVSRSVLRSYAANQSWEKSIAEANEELTRLARASASLALSDAEPHTFGMATTFVGAAISLDDSPLVASLAWTDDSVVWGLVEGNLKILTQAEDQREESVHTGSVRALPHKEPRFHQRTITLDGMTAIFVMSDGVGVPLEQSFEVRETLAQWWREPPDAFTFGRQVGFARKSHMDDRTVVGIWFPRAIGDLSTELPAVSTVKRTVLGPMTPIGDGPVGDVYRLDSFALPGVAGQLAYKELKASLPPSGRDEAVRSMFSAVAFRDSLSAPDRADLDEYTTWPVAIVEDQGRPVGLLMPLFPPDFFMPVNPPGGQPGSIVCELGFVANSDAYAAAMGFDLSTANDGLIRLALAAQLAYAVARLHKHGIVYGDLSLHNAAVAINPPRIKLLDCDAAALSSDTGRRQLHSPFFAPPENASGSQKLQDDKTDVYKLALCILRMLVRGKGVTQLADPAALQGILDQEGLELVAKALSKDRNRRPSAKKIFEYFDGASKGARTRGRVAVESPTLGTTSKNGQLQGSPFSFGDAGDVV